MKSERQPHMATPEHITGTLDENRVNGFGFYFNKTFDFYFRNGAQLTNVLQKINNSYRTRTESIPKPARCCFPDPGMLIE